MNFLLYFFASLVYLFFFLFFRNFAAMSFKTCTVIYSMILICSLAVLLSSNFDSSNFAYAVYILQLNSVLAHSLFKLFHKILISFFIVFFCKVNFYLKFNGYMITEHVILVLRVMMSYFKCVCSYGSVN